MRPDVVEILVHRIGRAPVPVLADLLLGGNHVDELAKLAAQVAPATMNVVDERLRLVLGQHADLANARIHAVRQHEIDNPELAAKGRGRLAAMGRQLFESFAPPTRHDDRQGAAGETTDIAAGVRLRHAHTIR